MSFDMLDIIIYGGTGLFLIVIFFVVQESEKKNKIKSQLQRIKGKTLDEQIEEKVLSLKRETDTSMDGFGFEKISHRLSGRLQTAGLDICVRSYLITCIVLSVCIFIALSIFLHKSILLGIMSGLTFGFGIPHLYVNKHIKKRQKQFLKLFPDAIELIVRGLRAGLPVAESMQSVAEEISEPVASVFKEMCNQMKLGVPIEKLLADMADKLRMTEFNFFVISITLQRETGGNLSEILMNLAEVLRQRHILKLKIKAMSSEARASAIIIGSLPFVVILALIFVSPEYLIPLTEDFRGNIAAFAAFCSLSVGIFVMSKLTQFKI